MINANTVNTPALVLANGLEIADNAAQQIKNGVTSLANNVSNVANSVSNSVTEVGNKFGDGVVARLTDVTTHDNDSKIGGKTIREIAQAILDKTVAGLTAVESILIGPETVVGNDGTKEIKKHVGGLRSILTMKNTPGIRHSVEEIPADISKSAKALLKVKNYHKTVANIGDEASKVAAKVTYNIIRGILSPIAIFLPGRILAEGVSLLVAAVARAVTLVVTQVIGHVLPYALAAAVAGGVVLGLGLTIKAVSPVIAGAVLAGAVVLGYFAYQHYRINKLEQKVANLENDVANLPQQISSKNSKQATEQALNELDQFVAAEEAKKGVKELQNTLGNITQKTAKFAENMAKAEIGTVIAVPTAVAQTVTITEIPAVKTPVVKEVVEKAPQTSSTVSTVAHAAAGLVLGSLAYYFGAPIMQSIAVSAVSLI